MCIVYSITFRCMFVNLKSIVFYVMALLSSTGHKLIVPRDRTQLFTTLPTPHHLKKSLVQLLYQI